MNKSLKISLYVLSLLAIAFGLFIFIASLNESAHLPGPWFDDAYMYIRYAENINAGKGYCWNTDWSPIFGLADIPYTYLIALIKKTAPALSYDKILVWLPIINYGLILPVLCFGLIRFCTNKTLLSALMVAGLLGAT